MKCPSCKDVMLTMSERQGIEIDYCPQCRGVWLDRGELDKLLERALAENGRSTPQAQTPRNEVYPDAPARYPERHGDGYKGYHKKPKSWLSDLFD